MGIGRRTWVRAGGNRTWNLMYEMISSLVYASLKKPSLNAAWFLSLPSLLCNCNNELEPVASR